jgi:acetyl-CoA acyltransferase
VLRSEQFAKERLGLDKAFGDIPVERINVHGGSLAFGHPFGATGTRMVTTMANELALTKAKTALLGICAQGGQSAGAVMVAAE